MKIPKLLPLAAGVIAFGLLGCASTTFTSSWKAPDAKPLQFAAGDKVVTLVLADATSIRRSGEANLADELDSRGMKGVPAYTLLPEGEIKDEAKAKVAIEASGAVGVIVLRPMGSEQKVTTTPSTYYSAPTTAASGAVVATTTTAGTEPGFPARPEPTPTSSSRPWCTTCARTSWCGRDRPRR